jgi:hypothetical protein
MRVKAYSQLLESYRSLTIDSLSGAFGVSAEFVDRSVLFLSLYLSLRAILTPHLFLLLPLPRLAANYPDS